MPSAASAHTLVPPQIEAKKIIIMDESEQTLMPLIGMFQEVGVVAELFPEQSAMLARLAEYQFAGCVVNAGPSGSMATQLISHIRAQSKNPDIRIIVLSSQRTREQVMQYIRAGATDLVSLPCDSKVLYDRILFHFTPKQEIGMDRLASSPIDPKSATYFYRLLQATEMLSRAEPNEEQKALHTILKFIANEVSSNRTSLISVEQESMTGVVLATSDDPVFCDFPIDLRKYPEVLHVVRMGAFMLVEDTSRNTLTSSINEHVKTIQIGSLMVFPVRFQGRICGVLNIRRPKATELPPMDVLRVLQATANVMAAQSNMKLLLRKIYNEYAMKGK